MSAFFYNHLFFFFFVFFCNHFEELQTVLFEVKLIINNTPLTYVYPNTIETCLTSNHTTCIPRSYCHLFVYSPKRSPRDCVIKLCDNRIFKALLWIKNSFKSIDFDLAKHAVVSNINHRCNLFEKFQILKLRWAYWEVDLTAAS